MSGFFLEGTDCVSDCAIEYYENTLTGICTKCNSRCKKCINGESMPCEECNSPYYKDPFTSNCGDVCPDKYYKDNTTKACETCKGDCIQCL